MRMNTLGWLATIILTFGGWQLSAAEPAGIREPKQIIFEGVQQVAEKDVRAALNKDFDAILAAHPDGELSSYLRAIETTTQLGYRHSGFPQAKITAEYDEQKEKIVVHVEEGQRHFCGDIVVIGAKHVDTTLFAKSLCEPAEQAKTLWVSGRPMPHDREAIRRLINRLKEAFAAQGFFHAHFDFRFNAEPGGSVVKLEITIADEGPRAEIGKITIAGNERDSDADILNYLDLRPGQHYDSTLTDRLQARLTESGRFLGSHISRTGPQQIVDNREIVDLNLEIHDYEPVSPLSANFSLEEKALLQFRDWAERWARGEIDHDFVFEVSCGAAELEQMCADMELPMLPVESAGVSRVDVRVVLSATQGQVITLRIRGQGECIVLEQVYAFAPGRLLIGSLPRNGKLDLPITKTRVKLNWEASTVKFEDLDDEKNRFTLQCGVTFNYRDEQQHSPLAVTTSFQTAPLFSFLHHEEFTSVLNNGVWHITSDDWHFKFDAASGRLIEAQAELDDKEREDPQTGKLTIRTQPRAYSAELNKVETQLAAAKAYDVSAPWKSLLDFLLDDWVHGLRQVDAPAEKLAAATALQTLVQRWSPRWPFPKSENDDGQDDKLAFKLPPDKTEFDYEDFFAQDVNTQKNCTAFVLSVYRKLVPDDGWLWPVGRDLILSWTTDSGVILGSLLKTTHSPEFGPLSAFAVSFTKYTTIQAAAAEAGRQHLNADDFRRDCEPLLSGNGWLSQWILSLAEAARALDEDKLRSLANFLPDNALLRSCGTAMLLTLKEEPEKSVAEALSRMLNVMWNLGLRDTLAVKLQRFIFSEQASTTAAPSSEPSADAHSSPINQQVIGTEPLKPASNEQSSPIHQRVPASTLVGTAPPKLNPNLGKTPDGNDTPVSQRLKALEAGESFIYPKGTYDGQGKLWYEQGIVPTRPASSPASSGGAENATPGAFTSHDRTTDTPIPSGTADKTPPAVTQPQKRLGKAALEALQPDDVVAKVGEKSILYRDVSPLVKMRMMLLLAKAKSDRERQAMETAALDPLTKSVIDQLVQNKMFFSEFERGMPRELRTDAQKRAEMDAKAKKIICKAFDESLSTVREKMASASQEEIDNLLRKESTIALLALLMKEQQIESHDQLDTALGQFGTTLETQIDAYGEYLMGMEGLRSQFKKKYVVTENEMLAYYQQHSEDYCIPAKARFEVLTAKFASFNGDRQAAHELVARMTDEVLGGKPLAEVARDLSQEPRAEEGGYYDWVSRASLASAAVDQAVFSTDVGVLSKIIQDDAGWHVVRVIERRESSQLSFVEARPAIQQTIESRNRKNEQQRYFSDLRARTLIWTIYDEK